MFRKLTLLTVALAAVAFNAQAAPATFSAAGNAATVPVSNLTPQQQADLLKAAQAGVAVAQAASTTKPADTKSSTSTVTVDPKKALNTGMNIAKQAKANAASKQATPSTGPTPTTPTTPTLPAAPAATLPPAVTDNLPANINVPGQNATVPVGKLVEESTAAVASAAAAKGVEIKTPKAKLTPAQKQAANKAAKAAIAAAKQAAAAQKKAGKRALRGSGKKH